MIDNEFLAKIVAKLKLPPEEAAKEVARRKADLDALRMVTATNDRELLFSSQTAESKNDTVSLAVENQTAAGKPNKP